MTVFGLWNGGSSYSDGYLDHDVESFPSVEAAQEALDDRAKNGHWWAQDFNFVNRPSCRALTPTVTGSYMDIYLADPTGEASPVPDMRLEQKVSV